MILPDWVDLPALSALLQVVLIDVTLAGDNAIVVGMAAAGLPQAQRGKAILLGILVATGLRILFAVVTVQLLAIIGLTLAGGFLLLWVAWKMFREATGKHHCAAGDCEAKPKSLTQALITDVPSVAELMERIAGEAQALVHQRLARLVPAAGQRTRPA